MYRLHPTLKVGVEANEAVGEAGLVANWLALPETARRPALMFGTSSDRIGTAHGQAYYATVSKSLHDPLRLPVAPYAGVSYSEYEERMLYPWGVSVLLPKGWSAMVMNDGVHTHLSGTYGWRGWSFTLLAVERRNAGVTIGTTF